MLDTLLPRPLQRPEHPGPSLMYSFNLSVRVRKFGVWLCLAALSLVLIDYLMVWRGASFGPSIEVHTNPTTLLALTLALIAVLNQRALRRAPPFERALWMTVLVVAAAYSASAELSQAILPDLALGEMGWNTALGLALLAAGQLCRPRHPDLAFWLCVMALIPPLVGLNGFILGQPQFYGEMAPSTALGLLGLSLGAFPRVARHRFIRLILKDNRPGRLTRLQLLIWLTLDVVVLLSLRVLQLAESTLYPAIYTIEIMLASAASYVISSHFINLLDAAKQTQNALRGEVSRDHLTGLATRRAASRYYEDSAKFQESLCLILIDIDDFKQINDRFGHAAGDSALQELSACLKSGLRITDLAARWGGEEFLVILRDAPLQRGLAYAQRLQNAIAAMPTQDKTAPPMTVSMGVIAVHSAGTLSLDDALKHADNALYTAKSSGRNAIYVADPGKGQAAVCAATGLARNLVHG